jgi:hypothetical protein
MLMKAYGIAPDTNPANNFSDAGNTYYTRYLAAAKRLGISAGVGGNLYVPEKEITRQEMFTMLYNALKSIGMRRNARRRNRCRASAMRGRSTPGQGTPCRCLSRPEPLRQRRDAVPAEYFVKSRNGAGAV